MRASQKQIEIEKSQVFDSKGNKGFEQKVKIEPIGITIPESESEVESKGGMRDHYMEESDCERREYRNYSYDEDSEFYDDRYDDGRHEDWSRRQETSWREEPDYYYRSSDKRQGEYRSMDKRRDEYRRVYYQDEENDCFYDSRCYRSVELFVCL